MQPQDTFPPPIYYSDEFLEQAKRSCAQADMFATDDDLRQELFGKLMGLHWQQGLEAIMRQGRVPPWIELADYLTKDEYRFLDLIEERAGYVMGDDVTVQYPDGRTRRVDSLTNDSGFQSPGNCKACINRCIAEGWVLESTDERTGRLRYDITERGRWAKDLKDYDTWFEDMGD